jgi:hypothetical protein
MNQDYKDSREVERLDDFSEDETLAKDHVDTNKVKIEVLTKN